MNDDFIESSLAGRSGPPLLPWSECDFFCIHDYAGTAMSPCGWRGRITDVSANEPAKNPRCPRCGSATLLRIPRPAT
jgi:hypothetical protein